MFISDTLLLVDPQTCSRGLRLLPFPVELEGKNRDSGNEVEPSFLKAYSSFFKFSSEVKILFQNSIMGVKETIIPWVRNP